MYPPRDQAWSIGNRMLRISPTSESRIKLAQIRTTPESCTNASHAPETWERTKPNTKARANADSTPKLRQCEPCAHTGAKELACYAPASKELLNNPGNTPKLRPRAPCTRNLETHQTNLRTKLAPIQAKRGSCTNARHAPNHPHAKHRTLQQTRQRNTPPANPNCVCMHAVMPQQPLAKTLVESRCSTGLHLRSPCAQPPRTQQQARHKDAQAQKLNWAYAQRK